MYLGHHRDSRKVDSTDNSSYSPGGMLYMNKRPNIRPGITFESYVMLQEHGHSVPSLGQESIIDL